MINRLQALLVAIGLLLVTLSSPAGAALICGTPGGAGNGSPSGIINDYWAGSGSPGSGSTSITLGTRRAGGPSTTINAGDLVLIIQMQDADINSTNTSSYGSGTAGPGSGVTNVNNAGRYEYVRATNTASAGGNLTFTPALTNGYSTRNYTAGSNGQSRWQVIRVPQYANATATSVTAPAWDGTTGGVVAMDVENALTLGGTTAINVNGLGFRGGAGRQLDGAAGADTDFRTLATAATNASKGEGIAGTPRYLNNTTVYNAAPTLLDAGAALEGYPNGSYARGAPGNAGGGGTDGNPPDNDQNSGGGGGSNYGVGGQGGNAWNSGDTSGGRGGAAFSSILAFNRVFLGGGGGAGTTNNGTSDAATYTNPPGVSCTAGAGACSSGAAGGGIVLIRAGSISGSGVITARGSDGYNVENDGGGGGGGGGTVVLQSYFNGNATVDVSGGNGGNTWRSHTALIDRHGPGGGGGGGFIAYSPTTFSISPTFAAGIPGKTSPDQAFGSTSGNGGYSAYDLPNVPGVQPGTFCPPAIKAVSLSVDNGVPGVIDTGDTVEYTVAYRNGSSTAIGGFNITDTLPAGMSYVAGSLTVTPSGTATGGSANSAYNGGATNTLLASNISLPAGGIITARLRAVANAPVCSDVLNQADSIQNVGADDLGLTDNADSTQNEGGLPSGTYIDQTPYGTGGATDPTGFTMSCLLNLSTSTKSWVDLNGGDQEPGDVIRYTITINNTGGGAATGVTVADTIDAGFDRTSFSLVSPSGATYTYNAGTGALSVTGLGIPVGGSLAVVFDVTIAGGTAPGTVINNTATVSSPIWPGTSPAAPPLTVSASSVPVSGNKPLYLYDGTASWKLSRTKPSGLTGTQTLAKGGGTASWTLSPALAASVRINASVPVNLWLASNSTTQSRVVEVRLSCASAPGTYLGSGQVTLASPGQITNSPLLSTFTLTTANGTATLPMTCAASDSWRLDVYNRTTGTGTRNVIVYPMSGTSNSYVYLPSQNVINVDSITYYDGPYNTGSQITSIAAGNTVYIRATVSDPFGSYDINANPPATRPTVTISNPSGTPVLPATAMTELGALTTAGTKTFEYAYPVPASPTGNWTVRVDAAEGTEGAVSDFGREALPVIPPQPLLTILKSANGKTNAKPGEYISYSVTVANTGTGAAANVKLTDELSPYTAFCLNCMSGQPFSMTAGSGLTLGIPEYSSDNGNSWNYPAGTSGSDGNITNWRIQMGGNLPPGNNFTLNYQTLVE